jgi:hypothetical protein
MRNHKPSVEFDELFGTNISQQYKFPFNLSADEVWEIIHLSENFNVDRRIGTLNREKMKIIIDNIDFPYDVKSLSDKRKRDLLMGMASCFNADDIIWYIEGNGGCSPKSQEIEKEMGELLNRIVGWVVSRNTWERMKEQMLVLP